MEIRDLVTRDTNIVHLLWESYDLDFLAEQTGISKDVLEMYNTWFLHDGLWYFFKMYHDGLVSKEVKFINELMGEVLAKKLETPVVHYMIAEDKGRIGLMSENFVRKDQSYHFMKDLRILSQFYNDSNLPKLRRLCKDEENYRQLISEIFKMVAIDLYMSLEDRKFQNIQFTRRDGELHLTPLYDFEDSFDSSLQCDYYSALLGFSYEEIEKYPLLGEYLDKLFDSRIGTVLEQVEDERKIIIPKAIKRNYSDFEEKKRMVLKR